MAATVGSTSKKIVLDLTEGTQTISPILNSATDDGVLATGKAIGGLLSVATEQVKLVVTETLVDAE